MGPYLAAVRAHKVVVALVALVTLLAAVAWIALRPPSYEATAQMLVTPLSQDDQDFLGLQLLRDSGDPTRTVQTAATLVDANDAAQTTARRLGGDWDLEKVREAVSVQPEGQSNILAVTAKADDAREAARVANTFVRAALASRNRQLTTQVSDEVARLRTERDALRDASDPAATELASRIDRLSSVASRGDPTLRLSQAATPPIEASGVKPQLLIPLALIAGLALGVGAAVLLEVADPRVRSEEELRAIYPLPVLVRIPMLSRRERTRAHAGAWAMPPAVREAFRTVLAQLEAGGQPDRTLMITSASSGDGKTTSAISLALAMANAGHRVVLMDFDIRKPDVGRALGIDSERPMHALLDPEITDHFNEMLTPAPHVPLLSVLTTGGPGEPVLLDALTRRAAELIGQARASAEFVVIDTPPLGEVSDALRIAHEVDAILLVAKPGHTNRTHLEVTRDLLERTGRTPTGYVVVRDTNAPLSTYYYGHGMHAGRGEELERIHVAGTRQASPPR